MRRLILIACALVVVLIIAITALIFAGRGQPPSVALQRFYLDDCLSPCVMGATLGKTSYGQALALFQKIQNDSATFAIEKSSTDSISLRMMDANRQTLANEISVSFAHGVVDSIQIAGVYGPGYGVLPTLGDLVSRYGSPQCAQSNPTIKSSFGDIIIVNPKLGVKVLISGWIQMDWNTPVGSFTVYRYDAQSDGPPYTCSQPWRGIQRLIRIGTRRHTFTN